MPEDNIPEENISITDDWNNEPDPTPRSADPPPL